MNEANMYQIFSKKHLPLMKKLLEGEGVPLENKYAHGFTGFVDACTLVTCNNLCYPFVDPSSSRSGFDKNDFENDNDAINERVEVVGFNKKFKDTGHSFKENEWA